MGVRSGYTLFEMLVAVSIFSFTIAALGTASIAGARFCRTSLAEAELAIRARELREKMLFHLNPPTSQVAYDGLLSAAATSRVDSTTFFYNGEQLPVSSIASGDRSTKSHRLVLSESNNQTFPKDEQAPNNSQYLQWLKPGGFYLDESVYSSEQFITPTPQTTRNGISRVNIHFVLKATAPDGTSLGNHEENMIVPLLNSVQEKFDVLGFYNNTNKNSSASQ